MGQIDYNAAQANNITLTPSRVADRDAFRALPQLPAPRPASEELLEPYRDRIVSQARYSSRNDGLLKEIGHITATYVIGDGLKLQPYGGDQEWQERVASLWRRWSQRPEISGRFSLPEIQHFTSHALDHDGEIFIALIYDPSTKQPPKLQIIESQQVGGIFAENQSGIVTDPVTGQPTAYLIADKDGVIHTHPAAAIVHIANFERPTALRGTPDFETSINGTHDRYELNRLTMTRAKKEAAQTLIITQDAHQTDIYDTSGLDDPAPIRPNPVDPGFPGETPEQQTQRRAESRDQIGEWLFQNRYLNAEVQKSIGGQTIMLQPGQSPHELNANSPGGTFEPYMRLRMFEDCLGTHVPFHILDPSSIGGAPYRGMLATTQAGFNRRQNIIIKGMTRIATWVIACWIDMGLIPYVPDFDNLDFQGPARITADYGRDARTDREDLQAGIVSWQDNFEARGLDFATQVQQQIAAVKLVSDRCRAAGLDPSIVLPLMFPATSNQSTPQQ